MDGRGNHHCKQGGQEAVSIQRQGGEPQGRRERTKQRSRGTAFLMETAGAKALGQECVCMKNWELANNDKLSQKEWASQPNLCKGVNIQYQGFSEVVAVMVLIRAGLDEERLLGATQVENERGQWVCQRRVCFLKPSLHPCFHPVTSACAQRGSRLVLGLAAQWEEGREHS